MNNSENKTFCVVYRNYRTANDRIKGICDGYIASFHHNGIVERLLFEGYYHWTLDGMKEAIKKKYHIKKDFSIEYTD